MTKRIAENIGTALLEAIVFLGVAATIWVSWQATDGVSPFFAFGASNASTTVVVGNNAPSVTSVVLNGGSAITLTANTTTNVNVTVTISDNNGCSDITSGTTTVMMYRTSFGSSSCMTGANNLYCYLATSFTNSSTCGPSISVNATTTFAVYYFAQATDGSSAFSSSDWTATVVFKDLAQSTGTADSTGRELNTLTALDVTTSSINYGTLSASSTTGGVNQVTTSTNAGNSSTTLRLSAIATLTSGANSIATTSQRYSTSSFTFAGTSTALQQTATDVPGSFLTAPTSTTNVLRPYFWGLEVPAGTATGTYNGTTLFTAVFATST